MNGWIDNPASAGIPVKEVPKETGFAQHRQICMAIAILLVICFLWREYRA